MGRKSRTKGASFEREVATYLSAMLGIEVKRRLGQARDSGHDLDAEELVVECKRRKTLGPVGRWYAQARTAAGTDGAKVPVVVMREDNGESLAVLSLSHLLTLRAGAPT